MPPRTAGPSERSNPQRPKPVDVGDDGTRPEEPPTATKPGEPQAAVANKQEADQQQSKAGHSKAGPTHKGHDED
jgi:hypothetical protein